MQSVSMRMVAGCCLIWASLASAAELRQHFPQDATCVYCADEQPLTTWFFTKWKQLGYRVPDDGQTFRWKDYVIDVPDVSAVQPNDLVIYRDNPGWSEAMAFMTDLKDHDFIAVMQPMNGGFYVIKPLERNLILGVGRPIRN